MVIDKKKKRIQLFQSLFLEKRLGQYESDELLNLANRFSKLEGLFLKSNSLPGKYAMLQGINIKFNKPVFVGNHLSIMGEVTYVYDAYNVLEINGKILTQDSKKVSSAKITVGLFQ
jgi:hypothetical protein